MLLSTDAKRKSNLSSSFFFYEIEVIERLELPVVFVNLNKSRDIQSRLIPTKLSSPYYTVSTSFQPKIIKYALDNYVESFKNNTGLNPKTGPHYYKPKVYKDLGL